VVIIQCPHCSTRFRLDEKKLSGRRQLLKCSRCRRVFPAVEPKPARREPRPQAREPESLSFAFDDEDWRAEPATADEIPDDAFLFGPQSAADDEEPPRRPAPLAEPIEEVDDDEPSIEAADEEEDEEEDVERMGSISLKPVLVFLFVIVGAYGLLARALYADPDWTRSIIERVPLVGDGWRGRALDRKVVLTGVAGRYEVTKEGTPVFVVSGRAHNQSTTPLKSIQIMTRLFDGQERLINEQLAFCGNHVRLELVRDLTIRQIAILKGLKPPQRFSIRPDEECSFVTFFTELPARPTTFTSEVAATQAHA
jgi:predicted Zn finger-like uncharacterized protein